MNSWLINKFKENTSRAVLIGAWGETSYSELEKLIQQIESEMKLLSFSTPSIIGLVGDFCPATVAWLIASERSGHWIIPISHQDPDTSGKLNQLNAQWVVIAEHKSWSVLPRVTEKLPSANILNSVPSGQSGLVLFSSGTSGQPKVMVQNFSLLLNSYQDRHGHALSILALLGFDHIGGLNTLLGAISSGSTLVIPESRSPEHVIACIKKHQVNVLPATPTFLNLLLLATGSELADLKSLRLITYGTEPMPQSLLTRLREYFPRVRLIQTFGTTETGILKTESPSPDSNFLRFIDPRLEWKVVDGELWLRSQTQITGYLNASNEKFTSDGWFKTGDKVELGPDNTLRILGRSGEEINVGGEKLMPTEVESIILAVPGVIDCLVYAEKNIIIGQTVVAEIMAAADINWEPLRTQIRQACRQSLAAYKVPTRLSLVNALSVNRLKKQRTL